MSRRRLSAQGCPQVHRRDTSRNPGACGPCGQPSQSTSNTVAPPLQQPNEMAATRKSWLAKPHKQRDHRCLSGQPTDKWGASTGTVWLSRRITLWTILLCGFIASCGYQRSPTTATGGLSFGADGGIVALAPRQSISLALVPPPMNHAAAMLVIVTAAIDNTMNDVSVPFSIQLPGPPNLGPWKVIVEGSFNRVFSSHLPVCDAGRVQYFTTQWSAVLGQITAHDAAPALPTKGIEVGHITLTNEGSTTVKAHLAFTMLITLLSSGKPINPSHTIWK